MGNMENTGEIDALRQPRTLTSLPPGAIKQRRRRGTLRFWLILAAGLLLVVGLVLLRTHQKAANKKPDVASLPIPVSIAAATHDDVPLTVDGIGTVQALNTVNIKPMVDGPLVDIHFREGQEVAAGEILAKIDPRTYQAAFDQAVAKKAQDQANLTNAKLDLGRYEKLAKSQYTTAQQADTQRSTVLQDEALVQQDEAQIDTARTNLSYTIIRAPVRGRTGIRQIDLGNIVHSTDTTPLTVVTTLQPISVVFTLPQQTLPDVTMAMRDDQARGGPDVDALPQTGGSGPDATLGTGKLLVLDNQVDQNTGTIKLKANFANPNLRLWPGAFVSIRLYLRVDQNVIVLPVAAIQRGPQGAFVFEVKPGHVVARLPVTVARQTENLAVVSAGLKLGQVVVTDGASRLTDGSHIQELNTIAKSSPIASESE